MHFFGVLLSCICLIYGSPETKPIIPSGNYPIVPTEWAVFRAEDDNLRYRIQGDEDHLNLPHHIRLVLQKEYEKTAKPSKTACHQDLEKVLGPLNLIKEKKHVLWVFPFLQEDKGFAIVFVQKNDGVFVKGSFRLGLSDFVQN